MGFTPAARNPYAFRSPDVQGFIRDTRRADAERQKSVVDMVRKQQEDLATRIAAEEVKAGLNPDATENYMKSLVTAQRRGLLGKRTWASSFVSNKPGGGP